MGYINIFKKNLMILLYLFFFYLFVFSACIHYCSYFENVYSLLCFLHSIIFQDDIIHLFNIYIHYQYTWNKIEYNRIKNETITEKCVCYITLTSCSYVSFSSLPFLPLTHTHVRTTSQSICIYQIYFANSYFLIYKNSSH